MIRLDLSLNRAGPGDRLLCAVAAGSGVDFQAEAAFVFVREPGNQPAVGTIALSYRIRQVTVLDRHTLEIVLPAIGGAPGVSIPEGTYEVVVSRSPHGTHFQAIAASSLPETLKLTTQPVVPFVTPALSRGIRGPVVLAPGAVAPAGVAVPAIAVGSSPLFTRSLARLNLLASPLQPVDPSGPASSVRPYADGLDMFQAIRELVEAEDPDEDADFLYLAIWALDERMQWTSHGQRPAAPGTTIAELLLDLAARQRAKAGDDAGCDVRLLIWRNADPTDDPHTPGNTYVDRLVACEPIPWSDLSDLSDADFLARARSAGSSAPTGDLLAIFHALEQVSIPTTASIRLPTGIRALFARHPGQLGSHHQKLITRGGRTGGAYVGGLNFLKDYWDEPEHYAEDQRRDTSHGSGSGGSGAPGPLHDTGTILRGRICGDVHTRFAYRWDEAVRAGWQEPVAMPRFAAHQAYMQVLVDHRFGLVGSEHARAVADMLAPIGAYFESNGRRQQDLVPNADYFDSATLLVDSDYLVGNDALVTWSWPGHPPRRNIWGQYQRRLAALARPGSFAYLENQYASHPELARDLHRPWVSAIEDAQGELEAFAYLVIPYQPETHWADIGGFFEADNIVLDEYRTLKWLEIKTARRIYLRRGGRWVATYDVPRPDESIDFDTPPAGMIDPKEDDFADLQFTVAEAYDMQGNLVGPLTLPVGDVLTDSDIMAFTLASVERSASRPERLSVPTRADPEATAHAYLEQYGIYVHSKASLFREGQGDDAIFRATIGSANLNERSLTGIGGDGSRLDSELNVFWSYPAGASTNPIESFWTQLWGEHGVPRLSPTTFREQGDANLDALHRHGRLDEGHLVRLDVVQRALRR